MPWVCKPDMASPSTSKQTKPQYSHSVCATFFSKAPLCFGTWETLQWKSQYSPYLPAGSAGPSWPPAETGCLSPGVAQLRGRIAAVVPRVPGTSQLLSCLHHRAVEPVWRKEVAPSLDQVKGAIAPWPPNSRERERHETLIHLGGKQILFLHYTHGMGEWGWEHPRNGHLLPRAREKPELPF